MKIRPVSETRKDSVSENQCIGNFAVIDLFCNSFIHSTSCFTSTAFPPCFVIVTSFSFFNVGKLKRIKK